MIRVVIADDHELIREGMKKLIEQEPDIVSVGEASSAAEVMNLLRSTSVDVLVLDISLPDRDGIEVLKDMKAEKIHTNVLMLSMHPENRYARRALKNGAAGYLTKEHASETIATAIRSVFEKGSYITEEVAEELYRTVQETGERPLDHVLSDREYQTFLLLGEGRSIREISERLTLSINTVNTYKRRIFEKMEFSSTAEVVQYLARHNLSQYL